MKRRILVTTLVLAVAAAALPLRAESPPHAAGAILGAALHVADVDRSVAFYTKGLGMIVKTQRDAGAVRETILGFDTDPAKANIILLSEPSGKPARAIEHSFGYDRLVLRMSDLPAVVARVRAAGYTASDVRDVAVGYRMAVATDPDGYRFEMVEQRQPQENAP